MNINSMDWADSDLESIHVQHDEACLIIRNDALDRCLCLRCTGLAGLTNLCIWDDMILRDISLHPADPADEFVRQLYSAYGQDFHGNDGRCLDSSLLVLTGEIINGTTFRVYCQQVEIQEI